LVIAQWFSTPIRGFRGHPNSLLLSLPLYVVGTPKGWYLACTSHCQRFTCNLTIARAARWPSAYL